MEDETEAIRRKMLIIQTNQDMASLESKYGRLWTTNELTRDFEVIGFLAPFISVKHRSDGKKGSLQFQHKPRYYFNFEEIWIMSIDIIGQWSGLLSNVHLFGSAEAKKRKKRKRKRRRKKIGFADSPQSFIGLLPFTIMNSIKENMRIWE